MAPNDTTYKRWSCHSGNKLLCKMCRHIPPPSNGCPINRFWVSWPCGPAGWQALLLINTGDVETNPGPTPSHKRVWICDICYKQIHVRTQHHPTPPDSGPNTLPTYTTNITTTQTQTHVPHSPCSHRIGKAQTQPSHPLTPFPPTPPRDKYIHISHTSPTPLIPRTTLIHTTSAALDTIPELRVPPTCHALTTTTPHPSTKPALPSPLHPHTLSAYTHAIQTRVTATTAST